MFDPHRLRQHLGKAFLVLAALLALSWSLKGRLVGPGDIDTALREAPRQIPTAREAFSFSYKGRVCSVKPVAEYELWGLVVSHNNIHSMADIYHDSTSVDTKDLCVIWGDNFASDDYLEVEYWSGPWTCYFRYPSGVTFRGDSLGNNHLISDSDPIRTQIADIRKGDQVHLEGLLVNYQMDDWGKFWRNTSTTRKDTDCEVIFVERLEVLRQGTPGWYLVYRLCWILLLALPFVYLYLLWVDAGKTDGSLGRLD